MARTRRAVGQALSTGRPSGRASDTQGPSRPCPDDANAWHGWSSTEVDPFPYNADNPTLAIDSSRLPVCIFIFVISLVHRFARRCQLCSTIEIDLGIPSSE